MTLETEAAKLAAYAEGLDGQHGTFHVEPPYRDELGRLIQLAEGIQQREGGPKFDFKAESSEYISIDLYRPN